ncbi:serine/threonine-protein kinase 25-like [Zootermopsis nevadensis]|nr:serine/threonine-protein kinase 25-like [Zootermopsis nevadensis]
MTVKGPHSIKPPNDEPPNHKIPQKVQNGSGPPQTKSPPKDSNLNHYRSEKATPSRPHTAAPAAPIVDNRKDRDRERERETKEAHSREKRTSKEMGPLDHRGELGESGEKKPVQRGRDANTNSSSSSSKPSHVRSPCLSGVIYPLISELQRRHLYNARGPESSHKTDAIEELKNAFELAERASPGISDLFVREMVQKLLPAVTETRIKGVMDKLTR